MRTLEEAIADRKTENDRAAARAAEKRHQENLERQRQQQRVATLMQAYIEETYDIEWPDTLYPITAIRMHPGSFSVAIPLYTGSRVELVNPVQLHEEQEDPLVIMQLRHTSGAEWKASRDGLYMTYTNFLDALMYAKGEYL